MKKLGLKGRSWLKGFHIFFACAWVGTGISMMLMSLIDGHIQSGDEIYAVNASIKLLDDYIIIPAALGSLITGLFISLYTNWGFFKFNWVIFKWVATLAQIIFGTFWLGPWTNSATAIADLERGLALQNNTYLYDKQMGAIFGGIQVLLLIAQVLISAYKPWGKRGTPD
ncbi:hypothetical protein ACOBQJ_07870 [Pelotomaculum propionicicum]|uniref:hypothetical protein n=1 Tax=Pelotomaculum propionicicum TaxID=258475 RepID=UPI003B8152FF